MGQKSSLTQSAYSVRQALTGYTTIDRRERQKSKNELRTGRHFSELKRPSIAFSQIASDEQTVTAYRAATGARCGAK
jgi:hypothetical protein